MHDGYFSYNSQVLPAPSLTDNTEATIKLVDPFLYSAATLFASLLNTNLQPRFSQEAAHCNLTHINLDNLVDGYAVAQITSFPLYELSLKDNDLKFPHLNVMVEEEYPIQLTLSNGSILRQLCFSWILPPLTTRQYNRIYHFLGEASKIWEYYGTIGYDPKTSDHSAWRDCGVSFGWLESVSFDPFYGFDKTGKEAGFPCLEFRCSFLEREQQPIRINYDGYFNSAYIELDLIDGYNPAQPLNNFIDGYVNLPLIISNISPTIGSINGNTLVSISGSGFIAANIVGLSICGSPAKSILVKTPNLILAVTNPQIAGQGNVILQTSTNGDATLINGFTYQ